MKNGFQRKEIQAALSKRVGNTVASIRHKQKLSQEKLAELSGLHRNTIGLIERGEKSVSISNLCLVAQALHTSASSILKETGL